VRHIAIILILLTFVGCSNKKEDPTAGWSASRIYNTAKESLRSGNYEEAVKYFESLEARYPFGRFAEQAQLEIAYAYYKYGEPELAIAAADRFIRLHPRHVNVPYAYYIKGLANYTRGHSIIDNLLPRDYSENDAKPLMQAYQDFSTIVRKYPGSRYAKDAEDRLAHLRNLLAAHELHVAEYYMKRKAYLAAANRCIDIIERFQGTDAVPISLSIMTEAYTKLGLEDLARDSQRVLDKNFPEFSQKN
jgi:outer membrane protein assembly factor BamD